MMTTIETYVRRGRGMVRKWAVNPGVRLGVKIGVYALSGFLLSAAALANSPMPLVMGLVCALTGWEAAVLAVGGAAGYLLCFVYALAAHTTAAYRVIACTYMISIVLLLFLNKGMHFKASGHACSTAGPLVAMCYFLGGWAVPAGIAVCALVIWASMETKQHRFWELMTGSAVSGVTFLCLAALI